MGWRQYSEVAKDYLRGEAFCPTMGSISVKTVIQAEKI